MSSKSFYNGIVNYEYTDDECKVLIGQLKTLMKLYDVPDSAADKLIKKYNDFADTHISIEEAQHLRRQLSVANANLAKYPAPMRFVRSVAEDGYKAARSTEKVNQLNRTDRKVTVSEAETLAEITPSFKEFKKIYALADSLYIKASMRVDSVKEVLHALSSEFKDNDATERAVSVGGDYMPQVD